MYISCWFFFSGFFSLYLRELYHQWSDIRLRSLLLDYSTLDLHRRGRGPFHGRQQGQNLAYTDFFCFSLSNASIDNMAARS